MDSCRDQISIGNKKIGKGHPCFIIAEAGVNHNGNPEIAKKLIIAAAQAGADAIKFQTFQADNLVTREAPKATYQSINTGDENSQYSMLKSLEFSADIFKELVRFSELNNIIFLSTPFDLPSLHLLEKLNISAYKIASGEITNIPFIRQIAKTGKPIILSSGMSWLSDIEFAIRIIVEYGSRDIILLHCTTSYPTDPIDVNLKALKTMHTAFKLPTGYSDHTLGISIPIAAVSMGAVMIEKHLSLNKNDIGPDHKASMEPDEFKEMVTQIRVVEEAMGDGIKKPTKQELSIAPLVRKSIRSSVHMMPGDIITESMVACKRPSGGLDPQYIEYFIGKKVIHEILPDTVMNWNMVE